MKRKAVHSDGQPNLSEKLKCGLCDKTKNSPKLSVAIGGFAFLELFRPKPRAMRCGCFLESFSDQRWVVFAGILFLLLAPVTASQGFDWSWPPLSWSSVMSQVKAGHPIAAMAEESLNVVLSGFDPEERHRLRQLINLLRPHRVQCIQVYDFVPGDASCSVRIRTPIDFHGLQRVQQMWVDCTGKWTVDSLSRVVTAELERGIPLKLMIVSRIDRLPIPDKRLPWASLPPVSRKNAFDLPSKANIGNLAELEDWLCRNLTTWKPNGSQLTMREILTNLRQEMDCTEFATVAFELLRDRGIPAQYVMGAQIDWVEGEAKRLEDWHTWVSFPFLGRMQEIDPSAGRIYGCSSFMANIPASVVFGTVEELKKMDGYFLSFHGENGVVATMEEEPRYWCSIVFRDDPGFPWDLVLETLLKQLI